MILATYNCFQIPVDVAFAPPSMSTMTLKVVNAVIDLLFFVDIIISCRTSFMDEKTGVEVNDTIQMAKVYTKGQLTIDIFATIPFDSLADAAMTLDDNAQSSASKTFFKLLGGLKLIRVLRLNKIITYLRLAEETKALLKLMKLIFLLILYIHIFGCAWWLCVSDEDWIPPTHVNEDDYYMVYD